MPISSSKSAECVGLNLWVPPPVFWIRHKLPRPHPSHLHHSIANLHNHLRRSNHLVIDDHHAPGPNRREPPFNKRNVFIEDRMARPAKNRLELR